MLALLFKPSASAVSPSRPKTEATAYSLFAVVVSWSRAAGSDAGADGGADLVGNKPFYWRMGPIHVPASSLRDLGGVQEAPQIAALKGSN
jgi:hypothetical protein